VSGGLRMSGPYGRRRAWDARQDMGMRVRLEGAPSAGPGRAPARQRRAGGTAAAVVGGWDTLAGWRGSVWPGHAVPIEGPRGPYCVSLVLLVLSLGQSLAVPLDDQFPVLAA